MPDLDHHAFCQHWQRLSPALFRQAIGRPSKVYIDLLEELMGQIGLAFVNELVRPAIHRRLYWGV